MLPRVAALRRDGLEVLAALAALPRHAAGPAAGSAPLLRTALPRRRLVSVRVRVRVSRGLRRRGRGG
eukprot:scaffold52436_cov42-Phaeocystis_antarctica.AAC.2